MTPEQLDKVDEVIAEPDRKCVITSCHVRETKLYLHTRLHHPLDSWIVGFCKVCAKNYQKPSLYNQEALSEQDEFYLKITGRLEDV